MSNEINIVLLCPFRCIPPPPPAAGDVAIASVFDVILVPCGFLPFDVPLGGPLASHIADYRRAVGTSVEQQHLIIILHLTSWANCTVDMRILHVMSSYQVHIRRLRTHFPIFTSSLVELCCSINSPWTLCFPASIVPMKCPMYTLVEPGSHTGIQLYGYPGRSAPVY